LKKKLFFFISVADYDPLNGNRGSLSRGYEPASNVNSTFIVSSFSNISFRFVSFLCSYKI